eukprot:scaffold651570_cov45-Prasinocladus_malaysianus.AAC.1
MSGRRTPSRSASSTSGAGSCWARRSRSRPPNWWNRCRRTTSHPPETTRNTRGPGTSSTPWRASSPTQSTSS